MGDSQNYITHKSRRLWDVTSNIKYCSSAKFLRRVKNALWIYKASDKLIKYSTAKKVLNEKFVNKIKHCITDL